MDPDRYQMKELKRRVASLERREQRRQRVVSQLRDEVAQLVERLGSWHAEKAP